MSQLWKAYQNLEHDKFTTVELLWQLHGGLFVCKEVTTDKKLIFHRDQLRPIKLNEHTKQANAR